VPGLSTLEKARTDLGRITYGPRKPKSERGELYKSFLKDLLDKPLESVIHFAFDQDYITSSIVKIRILLANTETLTPPGENNA
jgi:hypothetical protein